MIRFIVLLVIALFVIWFSTQVKLGEYTCLGHMRRIWQSDETKDLRDGVKEKATSEGTKEMMRDIKDKTAPVVERVKRGVKAGVEEAADSEPAQEVKDAAKDAAHNAADGARRPAPASPR